MPPAAHPGTEWVRAVPPVAAQPAPTPYYSSRTAVGSEESSREKTSIHSVIPGLPGKRLMVSRPASQGCEAIFLSMDRVSSLVLSPPVSLPLGDAMCRGESASPPPPLRETGGSQWDSSRCTIRLTTGAGLSLLLHQSHRVGEVEQADPGSPGSE